MKKLLLIAAMLVVAPTQADELNYDWNTGRYTIKNTRVDQYTGNKTSDSYTFGGYRRHESGSRRHPSTNSILNAPTTFGPSITEQNRLYGR